jgi:hypothetical protein
LISTVSRRLPLADCAELAFRGRYSLDELAEVALEDYARALTGGAEAEALRADDDPSVVRGVHVCALGPRVTPGIRQDLEDFARDLALRAGGSGLGWA